jgi:hypothetical protein
MVQSLLPEFPAQLIWMNRIDIRLVLADGWNKYAMLATVLAKIGD